MSVSAESKGLICTKIVQNSGVSELRILKDLGDASGADFAKVLEEKELAGFGVYSQRTIA